MTWGNPYVIERPLMEGDRFVGQQKALSAAVQSLKWGKRLLLVYGPARQGRTSFLFQLSQELSFTFSVLSINLEQPSQRRSDTLVRELKARMAAELPSAEPVEAPPAGQDGGSAQPLVSSAGPGDQPQKVLVLVDGLSVLDWKGEGGASWVEECQRWLSSNPALHLVLAVQGNRPRPGGILEDSLISLPSVELEDLSLQETEDLLQKPVRGRMIFEFEALRRVWQLAAGHPYFTQLFGYVLFRTLGSVGRVGRPEVEKAIHEVLLAAQSVMDRVWQSCSPEAQVLLGVAAGLRGHHGLLNLRDLQDGAQREALHLSAAVVKASVGELLALGILRELSTDSYEFCVDLFRRWVAGHKSLRQLLGSEKTYRALRGSQPSRLRRALSLSNLGLWLFSFAALTAVLVLWNMRGAAERLVLGSPSTPTAPPFVTRATLVLGPGQGQIAYMSKETPDALWDVWVMRGDGSDPVRLTDDPANDMFPTWSPDGQHIAFVSDREGNREIFVMKVDGTQQINLTHHAAEDWTPAWSPDGASIAFSSYRDGNWEIYVMDASGNNPQRLTRNDAADYAPCWSPDGKHIAFQSNREGNWDVYTMDSDGKALLQLTADVATDSSPSWSPDGTTIAFETYRDGNMEVYLMAVDGSEQRNVTEDIYSNEHGPVWARRGSRLLYYSNRDGGWDIFSMKPDGTEKSNLTLSVAQEQRPVWIE